MRIIGVTACTTGIAHTYLAKEKLENAATKLGYNAKFETQGAMGNENVLTDEDINKADVVIIAADVAVDRSRFKGKPVVNIPISYVMKSATGVINSVAKQIAYSVPIRP